MRGRPRAGGERAPGRRRGRPAAIESVAIDQAAEIPIVEWVRPLGARAPDARPRSSTSAPTGRATWTWSALEHEAADRPATLLLRLGVRAGRGGRLPAAELGRVRRPDARDAAKIGAVCCAADADLPRARGRPTRCAARRRACWSCADELPRPRPPGRDRRRCSPATAGPRRVEHVLVVGADGASEPAVAHGGVAVARPRRRRSRSQEPDREAIAARDAGARRDSPSCSSPPAPPASRRASCTASTRSPARRSWRSSTSASGATTVMFIPSPLAHQTGFLYGMWLAFVLGSTQILQDVWEPVRAARALREWERHLRAGRDAVPRRPRAASWRTGEPRRRRCASSSSPAPRCRARWPSARPRCSRHGGLRRLGLDRVLPRHARRARRRARRSVWGTDGRALAGHPDPHHRRRGHVARRRRGGQLRGLQPLPVRGLPRPPRPDRRGADRRRLVPDRRPGDDRRRRLPADHRPGQGRRSTAAARRCPVAEIEQLLHDHPAVEEVAIVAMPDERLGERACAFVVRDGADGGSTSPRCASTSTSARSPRQYWPERVEAIDGDAPQRQRQDPEVRPARAAARAAPEQPVRPRRSPSDDPARRSSHRTRRRGGVRGAEGRRSPPTSPTRARSGRGGSRTSARCRRSCATSCRTAATCRSPAPEEYGGARDPVLALPRAARALLDVARLAADDRPRRQRRLALGRPVRHRASSASAS